MASSSDSEYEIEPSLKQILSNEKLNWIFVGGKGGVGKTTTSCSIAMILAERGKKVLLISTDPAHNISDALGQKIADSPTPVDGVENLSAMEINSKKNVTELFGDNRNSLISEVISAIPGIDEAISFAELMKQVRHMTHDIIVFDTAPTGHTLKFLGFPALLEKGVAKVIELKNKFSGIFSQFKALMGANSDVETSKGMIDRLEETKAVVEAVNEQFRNPDLTTFICVCIPEFLSVYESSRLVEVLHGYKIDVSGLVVNQVLFPEKKGNCTKCTARVKMQRKYLVQINSLFDGLSIVTMPLMDEEVRGIKRIESFGKYLLEPFTPEE